MDKPKAHALKLNISLSLHFPFAALKLNISLNHLAVKLRIHGRHPMLSYLSSLPIAALRSLGTEAIRFYDRNHQSMTLHC